MRLDRIVMVTTAACGGDMVMALAILEWLTYRAVTGAR